MRLDRARSQVPMLRARALVSKFPACARPLPVIVPRRVTGVRCLASKRDGDEKSWAEIASEATTVVK